MDAKCDVYFDWTLHIAARTRPLHTMGVLTHSGTVWFNAVTENFRPRVSVDAFGCKCIDAHNSLTPFEITVHRLPLLGHHTDCLIIVKLICITNGHS